MSPTIAGEVLAGFGRDLFPTSDLSTLSLGVVGYRPAVTFPEDLAREMRGLPDQISSREARAFSSALQLVEHHLSEAHQLSDRGCQLCAASREFSQDGMIGAAIFAAVHDQFPDAGKVRRTIDTMPPVRIRGKTAGDDAPGFVFPIEILSGARLHAIRQALLRVHATIVNAARVD